MVHLPYCVRSAKERTFFILLHKFSLLNHRVDTFGEDILLSFSLVAYSYYARDFTLFIVLYLENDDLYFFFFTNKFYSKMRAILLKLE